MTFSENVHKARVRQGAAFVYTVQSTCPVSSGDEGTWYDGANLLLRLADGTDVVVARSNQAAVLRARAATTAALPASTYDASAKTLTANSNGALGAIDGVTLAVGDVLAVFNQSTQTQNGLYTVTSLGGASSKAKFTRHQSMNASSEIVPGILIAVSEGTANADTIWVLTTNAPIALDSSNLTFARDAGFASSSDLASTSNGKGASLIGVEDAGGLLTATTVEAALTEITKKANAALGAPTSVSVTLAQVTGNGNVVARFTPGFAGKISKLTASVSQVVTTSAKAATFTPAIGGVNVTGGAVALTSANSGTLGAKIDGSAITAANAFGATDEITVVSSGVTAFAEGAVILYLHFDPAA